MCSVEKNQKRYLILRQFNERMALRLSKKALIILATLVFLTISTVILSLNTGSYYLTTSEVIAILFAGSNDVANDNVVWLFRFPRTLVAILVGMMMALSGAALQNLTRNGLADPSLVGISQGAALAVVASIFIFPELDQSWRSLLAFAGSIVVAIAILLLSYEGNTNKPIRFILLGIGISAFLSAITTAFLTYGEIYNASAALAWLAGSIDAANWSDVKVLFFSAIILIPLLLILSRSMAVIRLGEEVAISLGTNIKLIKYALIAVSVALAATATSIVGPIGFIGLIAPHAARRIIHSGVATNLLLTALIGALLLVIADLAGRTIIAPNQIPAGILTQIIGVPLFVYLLLKQKSRSHM